MKFLLETMMTLRSSRHMEEIQTKMVPISEPMAWWVLTSIRRLELLSKKKRKKNHEYRWQKPMWYKQEILSQR
jgi:hypothetical protein